MNHALNSGWQIDLLARWFGEAHGSPERNYVRLHRLNQSLPPFFGTMEICPVRSKTANLI
jgi:hypothetical protein